MFSVAKPSALTRFVAVPPKIGRQLSRPDRIAYQRAIEEVYWSHRVWPKDNPNPKPPFAEYLPADATNKKVDDYLLKSAALEQIWQRPITGEQMQAEMNRMAKNSRQPAVLAELCAALGNDPVVIAECLAMPVVADSRLRELYANDPSLHFDLKSRAEAELSAHSSAGGLKLTSGQYSEAELVLNGASSEGMPTRRRTIAAHQQVSGWQESLELMKRLALAFRIAPNGALRKGALSTDQDRISLAASLPVGVVSQLQEEPQSFWAAAILERGNGRLKIAKVVWPKETFDSWWQRIKTTIPLTERATDYNFKLLPISSLPSMSPSSAPQTDSWSPISNIRVPDSRGFHTAVWTGNEMIVWGGSAGLPFGELFSTGFIYNPGTDTWMATSTINAPSPRVGHTAVWTGTQMIIWGGTINTLNQTSTNTGAIYDPVSDTWTQTSTTGVPESRTGHAAVWTGTEMIVWGGALDAVQTLNTGGVYDPKSDTWLATSVAGAPTPRGTPTAVWTGAQMIIWGGNGAAVNAGGKYDPVSDGWTPTSLTGAPDARMNHTAIWDGTEMIVWGGDPGISFLPFNSGGRYNPSTDTWSPTNLTNAPDARRTHTAVWTGSEMIVWGGTGTGANEGSLPILTSGGIYNPATDQWTGTSQTGPQGALDPRVGHSAIWSGSEMIVWGGGVNTGGRYNPETDSWTSTAVNGVPPTVAPAVWTGAEMIVWGGQVTSNVSTFTNQGGSYNPALDSWTATSVLGAPAPREGNSAVWDGTEMIIWGGFDSETIPVYTKTGGRYNPATDTWAPTNPKANAPSARSDNSAIWTGTEMIIWGGNNGTVALKTGARYNPRTDRWIATSTADAPKAREDHSAVWTGREMIVWGGDDAIRTVYNTGGVYDPSIDTWTAVAKSAASGVPSARTDHAAVWTGSQMIIWGGDNGGFTIGGPTVVFGTGALYDPKKNRWTAATLTNAPTARAGFSAVWTGSEMIVWGGDCCPDATNTGARYNPATDTWISTTLVNAPSVSLSRVAIWAGDQMIVWAGPIQPGAANTSGIYRVQ